MRLSATAVWLAIWACAAGVVESAEERNTARQEALSVPAPPAGATESSAPGAGQPDEEWIDEVQNAMHDIVWHSAMRIDRLFGSREDASAYEGASGSFAPALLWDEFDGFQPKLRFRVELPLPQLNERFNAFIGKVNRDEYVTERAPPSGAFPRQYGPPGEDQTLAGIVYRTPPKQGGRVDAGAGVRLRFPLDPYLKTSYVYERGKSETGMLSLRETVFWQNSQHAGFTTRMDLERIFRERWLLRWTTSGTISEQSDGVFGYSAIVGMLGLPNRRAIAVEVGFDGVSDAPVPLHDYGLKAAYRQSVFRDWLVMEVRSSVTWPKDEPEQDRSASFGVGIGFEMLFGTDEFLARPVTF